MTRYVALLGSINVGGNRLLMADLREALVSGGAEVVGNSPQQFAEFLKKETESARELLKVSGAKRDF